MLVDVTVPTGAGERAASTSSVSVPLAVKLKAPWLIRKSAPLSRSHPVQWKTMAVGLNWTTWLAFVGEAVLMLT